MKLRMAAKAKTYEDLSLSQVEKELRSAEAYLTARNVLPRRSVAAITDETTTSLDLSFKQLLTTRQPLTARCGSEFQHTSNVSSELSSVASEDEDELYYASDILDNVNDVDIQPRSKFDFKFLESKMQQKSASKYAGLMPPTELLDYASNSTCHYVEPTPLQLTKDLGNENDIETLAIGGTDTRPIFTGAPRQPAFQQHKSIRSLAAAENANRGQTATKKSRKRLEFLSQPRNQIFVEREKQRLLLEMEQLRECTFHPNMAKPTRSIKAGRLENATNVTDGATELQWLTLSPRQKITQRLNFSPRYGSKESKCKNVIERFHLDEAARNDSRVQARVAVETHQLQECTFKPTINPISKSIISMVDYKPIQHRVSDLQRAKTEYVARTREKLERIECGLQSFTPTINSKSREIASNKLAEKVETALSKGCTTFQHVTERLAEGAGVLTEKRLATQEYYDLLNEQTYAPKISDTSKKIVKLKPEFKMDFVARQQYFFRLREQERMAALEDLCDAQGGNTSYKPDIGNAEVVIKQLRPNRCAESSQQTLYRLTYDDYREAELKTQRLREEQYAQYTFKPEINSVSKALGRPSTLDELSHPVLDVQQDACTSQRLPSQYRKSGDNASLSRAALSQYFANKRFRSRVARGLEEANHAECTFRPALIAYRHTRELFDKESRSKVKLGWQSENLLRRIEAERRRKSEEIEAKRNFHELKELEECTFHPNLHKPSRRRDFRSPSSLRDVRTESKPVIVRGLGRFLELKDRARKQQTEQKQREQKVFALNMTYEPRNYTVPQPFKLSETNKRSMRRRLKARDVANKRGSRVHV